MSDEPWPEVPGYVVLPGAAPPDDPDVAPAVEQGSRRRVVLRRLPELRAGERPAITEVLNRYAEVSSVDMAEPARLAEGADVLVLSPTDRTLADRSIAPRTTGQLVTALVPVASALEAIHAAGLGHGVVDRRAVSVDDEGRPRLADTGVAAALHVLSPREIPEPSARADLADFRRLALRLAERVAAPAVAEAFADPAVPATAGDAVELLLDLAPPEPLPGPVEPGPAEPGPAEPEPAEPEAASPGLVVAAAPAVAEPEERPAWRLRGVDGRWVFVTVVAVLALVVLVLLARPAPEPTAGRAVPPVPAEPTTSPGTEPSPRATLQPMDDAAGDDEASPAATTDVTAEAAAAAGVALCGAPAPAPEETPAAPDDWVDVVTDLYLRRSAALVTGQTSLLCEVYDPRSPGLAADIELDEAYRAQQVRPDGLDFLVESAEQVQEDGAAAILEVTDQLQPYRLVTPSGDVVAELPGVPSETWLARVVPDATGTEWRFG
jgi:hypothetical protein